MAQLIRGYVSTSFRGQGAPQASMLFLFYTEENSNEAVKVLIVFSLAQLAEVCRTETFAPRLDSMFVGSPPITPEDLREILVQNQDLPHTSTEEMKKFEGAMLIFILTALNNATVGPRDRSSDDENSSPPSGGIGFLPN